MSKKNGKNKDLTVGMIMDFMDQMEKIGKSTFVVQVKEGKKHVTEYILQKRRRRVVK